MSDKRSSVAIKLLFTIASLTAVFSLVLLFMYVSTADERVLKSFDSAKVLVATKTIAKGTSLDTAMSNSLVEERSYPVKSVPKNSLQQIDAANGSLVALGDIPAGQILLVEAFGAKVQPKVELSPEKGKVAVTVELGYGARLGTFLKPGIDVSLFATYTDSNSGKKTTSLLFQSIQILAIGDQVKQDAVNTKDSSANFVTFAVEIEKADKLIEAAQTAALYLALPSTNTTPVTNS